MGRGLRIGAHVRSFVMVFTLHSLAKHMRRPESAQVGLGGAPTLWKLALKSAALLSWRFGFDEDLANKGEAARRLRACALALPNFRKVVHAASWRRDRDVERRARFPEFFRIEQARRVIVGEDRHASDLSRKYDLQKSFVSKRGPNGHVVHELRGPCRLEALGKADMLRDRREAQRAGAERADGAAGLEHIGFALPARVQKGQLHGDDFARRRLNGGDHAGEGFPAGIGIAGEEPDRSRRRLREAARAQIGFDGSAGGGCA